MKLNQFYWDINNVRVLTRKEMVQIYAKNVEEDESLDDTPFWEWVEHSGDYDEMPRRIKHIYRKMRDYIKSDKYFDLTRDAMDEYAIIKHILVNGYGMDEDEFNAEVNRLWEEII